MKVAALAKPADATAGPPSPNRPAPARGAALDIAATVAPDPKAGETALGLDRDSRREVQRRLTAAGFATAGIDGVFGPRTRAAITAWQQSRGFATSGYVDEKQLSVLGQEAPVSRGSTAGSASPTARQLASPGRTRSL